MLKKNFPKVHTILGSGNWWYTKSINEGLKYAQNYAPDYALLLNDDIEFEPDYISNFFELIKKIGDNCIIGSLNLTKEDPPRILFAGNSYKSKPLGILKNYYPFLKNSAKIVENIEYQESILLPGRGLLIPYQLFNQIGYFDEKLKQYHSDSDFCLKAKKKGYTVYISYKNVVYSHLKMTDKNTSYIRSSVIDITKSFFISTSRNYLPSIARLKWRYFSKILWIFNMIVFILLVYKNHFFKRKI